MSPDSPESRPEASGVGTGRPGEALNRTVQGETSLGNPPADYLATLREKKPIPLAEFLNAARDSKYFTEPESSSIYCAQAWATVHYLMLGEANRRGASELAKRDSKQAIPAFLELLGQGVHQAVALAQATGMDLEKLERTVVSPQRNAADYPRPDRIGARTTFTLKSLPRDRDLRARILSEAEALYYEGDLLLHLGRYDAARLKLEAALALDPKLRPARVARGLLAVQLNHWVEARRELQEVAEVPESGAPPSGYLAHFYYAMALLRQPFSPAPAAPQGATAADVELAERELRRVIQLQENFAPAYCLLALIEMRSGNLSEAQRLAERALALEPQSISNRLALAEIQSQKGNLAEAQQTLAVAAASARPEDRTRMAELLERMKVYGAQLESRRAGQKLRAEETERPRWEKDKLDRGSKGRPVVRGTVPPAKQAYPRELPEITRETPEPARAPAQPPKYGFLRGKVAQVSCKPAQDMAELAGIASLPAKRGKESNKLAVILSVEGKTRVFRFFKEDLSQVAMISAPREGSVCESMGRTVSVNYLVRPESRGFGTGFDGEVMSIEFAAREKPPVEAVPARTAGSPRRAAAPQPKPGVFRGTVEEVSCGRPMVFTLRGKDRSGKVKVMRLRAGSATEFFATATKGLLPTDFDACKSKGLAARANYRPLPSGEPYDGELTRVEFDWTRK